MRIRFKRLSRSARILITVVVIAIVILLATVSAAAFTARSPFCVSCHEMEAYYDSWAESAHAEVPCVECHLPEGVFDYFKEKAFAFREVYTHFEGEVQAPVGVTRDIPQGNCVGCHEYLPVVEGDTTTFDHVRHDDAECLDCHARLVHRTLGSPAYVDPSTMDACQSCHDGRTADDDCAVCHEAPHPTIAAEGGSGACDECHVEDTWEPGGFDHPVALENAHARAECTDCHETVTSADGSATLGDAPTDCASCHEAPHPDMGACDQCHTTADWSPSKFTHPVNLVGKHAQAECDECHRPATDADGSRVLGVAPTACALCHQAPHVGMGSCDRCHSPKGWLPSSFRHPFALAGAHAKASCTQCHKVSNGTLADASASCSSCHRSPHGGPSNCSRCHSASGWSPASFRHRRVGEHIPGGEHRLSCSSCHPSGFGSYSCTRCHKGTPGSGGDGGGGGDD